jgi:hypothetical protein
VIGPWHSLPFLFLFKGYPNFVVKSTIISCCLIFKKEVRQAHLFPLFTFCFSAGAAGALPGTIPPRGTTDALYAFLLGPADIPHHKTKNHSHKANNQVINLVHNPISFH